ncbi:hypothetical protein CTI12_AA403640 [Artemisia annua]|uniref:Uncharacterized protein n=1 Tax=Artemisia annua TaxID=35608 RepID=A0A2U1M9P4_ARTAN|nr:hypothetical protein CTI12_AA403640 [Artemisia annua]
MEAAHLNCCATTIQCHASTGAHQLTTDAFNPSSHAATTSYELSPDVPAFDSTTMPTTAPAFDSTTTSTPAVPQRRIRVRAGAAIQIAAAVVDACIINVIQVQRGQQTSRTDTIYKLAKAVLNLNFSRSVTISANTHADASRIRRNVPTEFWYLEARPILKPNSLKKFCTIMDKYKDTIICRWIEDAPNESNPQNGNPRK